MDSKAINIKIEGGHKLHGTVVTKTSKNGAMGLLAASLLNRGKTTLRNVPRIEEVFRIIEVFQSIGVSVKWVGGAQNVSESNNALIATESQLEKTTPKGSFLTSTLNDNDSQLDKTPVNDTVAKDPFAPGTDLEITPPENFNMETMDAVAAEKTRSVIMMIGPLIHSLKKFKLPQAGGCKLGSRTVKPHLYALKKLGVEIKTTESEYEIHSGSYISAAERATVPTEIVLYESGDTVTENAIIAAAGIPGTTVIKYASANYMGQEVCFFLEKLGVKIDGIGTTTITVHGVKDIRQDVEYELSEDPIESMFFLSAAIVTKSTIVIERCPIDFLEVELLKLEKMGFKYKILKRYLAKNGRTNLVDIETHPSHLVALEEKIDAKPYPGLNIDNLPFFAVIATQATGTTFIHDWVYEKRAIYLKELDKLGADSILADPHRIYFTGPTKLKAAEVICPPALRPAAIVLIGMLAAEGTSVLRNIYSINRGYEDIIRRLNSLGAKIEII